MKVGLASLATVISPCDNVEGMININDAARSKGTIFLKSFFARWALESFNKKMRKPQENTWTVKQMRIKVVA
jgi:hypothetical protein